MLIWKMNDADDENDLDESPLDIVGGADANGDKNDNHFGDALDDADGDNE